MLDIFLKWKTPIFLSIMLDNDIQRVLGEIFSDAGNISPNANRMSCGFEDIIALAKLLAYNSSEEELQQLLTQKPQFLLGALGYAQNSDCSFVTKPLIGTKYRADFGILSLDQGGCSIHLIELESASAQLFTRSDTPARRLQSALGQVRDWDEWIRRNLPTFVRDLIDHCKCLPVYPNRHVNGSFLLSKPDDLENAWRGFGGFDHPRIMYTIVIGRWSHLSENHRKRLVYLNQHDGSLNQIRTYDQIARRSYSRPTVTYY